MSKFTYLFLILLLFSCKKFEHQEPTKTASCELCAWAESMEGIYNGVMKEQVNSQILALDTVFVKVEHIFINENSYHDSTVMYFRFTMYKDSLTNANPSSYTGRAVDNSGTVTSSYYTNISLHYDSLRIGRSWAQSWPMYATYSYSGMLYR